MSAGGCFGIALGMLAIVAIVSALSGYFFYRNFGADLYMVRDDVQPIGERFIRHLDEQSFNGAYALLTEKAQADWPPEAFGEKAQEIIEKLGRVQTIEVLAMRTVEAVMKAESTVSRVPMDFPCQYDEGSAQHQMEFLRTDAGWRIDSWGISIDDPPKAEPGAGDEDARPSNGGSY